MSDTTRLINERSTSSDRPADSTHVLPRAPILPNRMDFVVARCEGKRVLHVGCVDAGLERDRFAAGQLLHQRLDGVAQDLCGVDADEEGLTFLRDHGLGNLFLGDLCLETWLEELQGRTFDVIVASEVIEHLASPGLFLANVQRLMTPGITELIVTVPNAFGLTTLRHMLDGVEYVNPDHNYWFSYYTITNLLQKHDFEAAEVLVYVYRSPSLVSRRRTQERVATSARVRSLIQERSLVQIYRRLRVSMAARVRRSSRSLRSLPRRALTSYLYNRSPFWGDGIVVVARLGTDTEDTVPTPGTASSVR